MSVSLLPKYRSSFRQSVSKQKTAKFENEDIINVNISPESYLSLFCFMEFFKDLRDILYNY